MKRKCRLFSKLPTVIITTLARKQFNSLAKRSCLYSLSCHQRAKFNFYGIALLAIEQFSIECSETTVIALTNDKGLKKIQLKPIKTNLKLHVADQSAGNVLERVTIGLSFTSVWMRKWRENFIVPIVYRSRCKTNSDFAPLK